MRAFGLLVAFLAVLAAGGYWNYDRNEYMDKDLKFRPFASYSRDQIEQLIEAHRQQAMNLAQDAGEAPTLNTKGIDESDLQGKIKAFDRFQHVHNAWENRHGQALQEFARVDGLEKELAIRKAGLDKEWRRILRRVITL